MSYFREQLESWLKTIDVKADRVLDIGGGSNPVVSRVNSWEVKEYKILDNELEEMKQKPDYVGDIQHLDILNVYFPDSAITLPPEQIHENLLCDTVFCLEVAEYWYNPLMALVNINRFMRKDGILYISFPFIYPHHNPEGKDYLRYTRWGVEKLLNESGFEILEITPRIEENVMHSLSLNIGRWFKMQAMHPAKGYDGHNEIGYCVKAKKI